MKYRLALCLILKDEAQYLPEWLDHHRWVGVEHFYIYDHQSAVPVNCPAADVTLHRWEVPVVARPQLLAYQHCIQTYRGDCEWIGFLDTDEFIHLAGVKPSMLSWWLKQFRAFGGICLNWCCYGDSFRDRKAPLVLPSYAWCSQDVTLPLNHHVKTIVNTRYVSEELRGDIHNFNYTHGKRAVTPWNEVVTGPFTEPDYGFVHLNHYITRSRADWQDKMNRGRVDTPLAEHQYQWQLYDEIQRDCNQVADLSILKR